MAPRPKISLKISILPAILTREIPPLIWVSRALRIYPVVQKMNPSQDDLKQQLKKIQPTEYLGRKVYPAAVRLKDTREYDRVAIITGDWPWRHHAWTKIDPADILSIKESELRLPPQFVSLIQEKGVNWKDAGWARLVFTDGSTQDVSFSHTGPLDFHPMPHGKSGRDIVDVIVDKDLVDFGCTNYLADIPTCFFPIESEAQQAAT
jgi:hypothetical protein